MCVSWPPAVRTLRLRTSVHQVRSESEDHDANFSNRVCLGLIFLWRYPRSLPGRRNKQLCWVRQEVVFVLAGGLPFRRLSSRKKASVSSNQSSATPSQSGWWLSSREQPLLFRSNDRSRVPDCPQ